MLIEVVDAPGGVSGSCAGCGVVDGPVGVLANGAPSSEGGWSEAMEGGVATGKTFLFFFVRLQFLLLSHQELFQPPNHTN